MTLPENSFASRALALSFAAIAVAAIWSAIAQPILGAFDRANDDTERLTAQYLKYNATAGQLASVEQALEARGRALTQSGELLEAQSTDVAAATLQTLLAGLINSNRGQMQMTQYVQDASARAKGGVPVAFSFAISNAGLTVLLDQINGLKPTVLVRSLAIRANPLPTNVALASGEATGGPFDDEPILSVEMQVMGFVTPKDNK